MRKIIIVSASVLVIILFFVITSCSSDGAIYSRYNSIKIDGEQIYTKNYPGRLCDIASSVSLFVIVDEKEYAINTFFTSCSSQLYVRENFEYITLNQAINDGIITGESVLNYEWPFEYFEVHDLINDISIDYIVIENKDRSELITIDDIDIIQDIQNSSSHIYDKFLIGVIIIDELDGYITIYDTNGDIYELEVTYNGIYFEELNSYQTSSDLLWLFMDYFEVMYD